MTTNIDDKLIADSVNNITEKLSNVLLKEFLKLPDNLKLNIVLIKSVQLLLANILCQVVSDMSELNEITDAQGADIKELSLNCALTGYTEKFNVKKH